MTNTMGKPDGLRPFPMVQRNVLAPLSEFVITVIRYVYVRHEDGTFHVVPVVKEIRG